MVQNRLHYATRGHTAVEITYERADTAKPLMGLTVFQGDFSTAKDISVAKNYLNSEELKVLNNLVSGYFDFVELQATRRRPMYMNDYAEHLNHILVASGNQVLEGGGTVSHKQVVDKARQEYQEFRNDNLSPVEQEYLQNTKPITTKTGKKSRTAS